MVVADELKKIYKRYHEDKLAHAFLLETNNSEKCYKDVLELVKTLDCPHEYKEDCPENCNLCSLVDSLNLPSLIVINSEGMTINKEQILVLQERFATKPVYARFNIYIINDCDRLNLAAANTMLKFLEEPTDDIIGFFITTNKENVISTIKSRCQIMRVDYDKVSDFNSESSEFIRYLNSIFKDDYDELYLERKDFIELVGDRKGLEEAFGVLETELVNYNFVLLGSDRECTIKNEPFIKNINLKNISKVIELVRKVLLMLRNNVNIDLILDVFYFEMRDLDV